MLSTYLDKWVGERYLPHLFCVSECAELVLHPEFDKPFRLNGNVDANYDFSCADWSWEVPVAGHVSMDTYRAGCFVGIVAGVMKPI